MFSSITQIAMPFLLEKEFLSSDEKICRIIYEKDNETFKLLLHGNLDPNYVLKTRVQLENIVFEKGSSLIFLVIQNCTIATYPLDYWIIMELLLEKNVDLEKKWRKGEGGGDANVLEYACENEELLLEDILLMLLRAATSQSAYIALNKVKNSERRQQIKKQLFQDFLSEQELEILDLESLPILEDLEVEEFFSICSKTKKNFDEKEIFRFIVEGKEEELRNLLDENLDSNYIFSQDINMNNFLCPKGTSLLLLTLQACVKYNSSLSLYKIIALLLEKGVDLEKECLGIDPLSYLCENEDCFSKEVVLCLLTSVNKTKALLALSQVRDIKKKLELEKTLNFKNFLPCFELERSFVENIVSISELNDLSEDILLTTDSPKNDEHFLSLGDVFEYGRDKKLALKISETSQLEEALKYPIFLKKCVIAVQL